ncbi:hypothetical protein [Hankyongella ginsenosidimutans]|nr:hypothetical protein [Hankyongella ginsenosidimutans]
MPYAVATRRLAPLVPPVARVQAAERSTSPWDRPVQPLKGRLVDLRV